MFHRYGPIVCKGIPLQTTSAFPISERNIPVDILENIEFPVPNSPYLTEK
ncbi:hypothetical protein EMIT040CA3_150014 [Bacillus pseudomycoides]